MKLPIPCDAMKCLHSGHVLHHLLVSLKWCTKDCETLLSDEMRRQNRHLYPPICAVCHSVESAGNELSVFTNYAWDAEMSPQLNSLSVSLSTFLSLYVYLSVNLCFLSFPSPLVSSLAFPPIALSICVFACLPARLPASHLLFSADGALSTTHRAEPLRKTNISLFLLSLRVSLGASFHKANNVMCYRSKPLLPPLHSYLPLLRLYPAKQSTAISSNHNTLKEEWQEEICTPNQESHKAARGVSHDIWAMNAGFTSPCVYRAFPGTIQERKGELNYLVKSNHN